MAGNKKDSGFVLQARDRQLLNEIAHMRLVDREMEKWWRVSVLLRARIRDSSS